MDDKPGDAEPRAVKQCCASLYESDLAKLLLGDSFHPGGTTLTEHLGRLLSLAPTSRVLDIATGKGTSAFHLAQRFGCEVMGVDYGGKNVAEATQAAERLNLHDRVMFQQADAERLPFADRTFDAVICECAFCTFPNKRAAAGEFARVLRIGGRIGVSDLTRDGALPSDLDSLLSWIACIADAQPAAAYAEHLTTAGLNVIGVEVHDSALLAFVDQMRLRLLATDVMVGLKKLALPDVDLDSARRFVKQALQAISNGRLGYAVILASKDA
jgi:SAM-dependent methyltransferase